MNQKLLVAVTFFFVDSRLQILKRVLEEVAELAPYLKLLLITNSSLGKDIFELKKIIPNTLDHEIHVPSLLGHPYLLTWSHLDLFRDHFFGPDNFSHYLYLEDDLLFTKANFHYWLESREILRPYNLIPAFMRYELKLGSAVRYATDMTHKITFSRLKKIEYKKGSYYLSLPQPYQGMYLLDRDLMGEHLKGGSSNPDCKGFGGIREKAAQGLIYAGVPRGFLNRHALKYDAVARRVDSAALVHHSTNSYADDPSVKFAKIPVDALIKHRILGF